MIISRRRADDKGRLLITTSNWSPELYNLLSLKLTLPVLLDGTVESLGSTEFYFGRKRKKTVCNTSLIILLTDVVNLESVYAILNLCASLVHCKNRSPTTLTFSAKAFPRPKWADSQDSKITQTVGKGYQFVYTLSGEWDIQLIIVCLACVINLANQGGSQSVGFNYKTHLLGGNSARCSTLRSGF